MCNVKALTLPFSIPAEAIGLPTRGAEVLSLRRYAPMEPDSAEKGARLLPAGYWKASGVIYSLDPEAPNIRFQAGLPAEWNGRLVQMGGGGIDGVIPPLRGPLPGENPEAPCLLEQGYAVFGSDSGHRMGFPNYWDCGWALNREALENFAHAQLKKTADAVRYLVRRFYGEEEERLYFYGGSNGGRECLQCLLRYPEDYDGAVCFYPVLYWVGKLLIDRRNECYAEALGAEALISKEQRGQMRETASRICGGADGVIDDLAAAEARRDEVEAAFGAFLNEKQMALLHTISAPLELPYAMTGGYTRMAGYGVWEGAPVAERFGTELLKLPAFAGAGTQNVLSTMVMHLPDFPMSEIDFTRDRKRLQEASALLDAASPKLDRFFSRGGKLLLLQGMADGLVPIQGTREYVQRLRERYGETLGQFFRYYELPGFGHTFGETFQAGFDALPLLNRWVTEGKAPETIRVTDCLPETRGRTREVSPVQDTSFGRESK